MKSVLAVDPGDTSGWCMVTLPEGPFKIGLWKGEKEPAREVDSIKPDVLVVENYLIRPPSMTRGKHWDHSWNKGSTMRIIGSLQTVADLRDLQFKLQEPSIKPVGYGWAGLTYVKGKTGTHIQDATAHLVYFLHKELKISIDLCRALTKLR